MLSKYADEMFVTDKKGRVVFFSGKQGYYVKNKKLINKIKGFYKKSFYICFILLIITLAIFEKNFWGIVGSITFCLGSWYLVNSLYISKVVKSLRPAKINYKELILSKYETEDTEEVELIETKISSQWKNPTPRTIDDLFLGIKRVWYSLSPGQLLLFYFFVGVSIILISTTIIKHEFGESPIDFFIAFIVGLIWGFAFFIGAKNMEGDEIDWWGFLNWKLPMILFTAACWSFAVYSLYKFFFMIFV